MNNPKSILDTYIGSEDLKAYGDYIFKDVSLENAGASTSSAFRMGGTHAGIEVKIQAATEIVIAATKTITIEINVDDAEDGSFATNVFSKVLAPQTIAIDDIIAKYIPDVELEEMFAKVVITTDDDQSLDKVNGYIRGVRV